MYQATLFLKYCLGQIEANDSIFMCLQGLLLVYDITDRNSYEMLHYWLESIRQVRCAICNNSFIEKHAQLERSSVERQSNQFT